MLRNFARVADAADPVLPAAPVVPVPPPAAAPDLAVLPDPPAAAPVVVPAPAPVPKVSRRRSAMTASAIPLLPPDGVRPGIRPGIDPKGWLRAFDVYDERGQASLFEGQGDEDVPAPRGE
ncbi:hypothetical protein GCM10010260_83870 [Streptomyces filipinensis]|uniref:Uncharacterized protein n=2 Tax=Streptomyces TaxID=1883 RepID=A0A918IKN4_9ACTN|nr:hypothetical protein GCM10010260_83870 [Streptomyces filipinensis]